MKLQGNVKGIRIGGPVERAGATMRIAAGAIAPKEITRILHVDPSYTHQVGDRVSQRTATLRKEAMWMVDSTLRGNAPLDAHIANIFERLPALTPWKRATRGAKVDIVCSISVSSDNQGFVLPTSVLREASRRGIELSVEVWVERASPRRSG